MIPQKGTGVKYKKEGTIIFVRSQEDEKLNKHKDGYKTDYGKSGEGPG